MTASAVHHYHKRKRIYQNYEPYPHPNKWKRFMDRLIYLVGVLGPVMTIPQILQIRAAGTAAGLSLLSWSSFILFSFFWLVYGIMHREKPIIIMNALGLFVNLIVVIEILMYG